ncbi:MAG: hypothetical protein FVQ80_06880 [Planctomycetes bacterium]|nr:hypothetical protein [Planctomycetota bacterium]
MKVYLTKEEFDDLLEYSMSVPTGTTIGKKWKRHVYSFEAHGQKFSAYYVPKNCTLISDTWLLGTYAKSKKPGYVDITWKDIEVVGELEIDKVIRRFEDRGK